MSYVYKVSVCTDLAALKGWITANVPTPPVLPASAPAPVPIPEWSPRVTDRIYGPDASACVIAVPADRVAPVLDPVTNAPTGATFIPAPPYCRLYDTIAEAQLDHPDVAWTVSTTDEKGVVHTSNALTTFAGVTL